MKCRNTNQKIKVLSYLKSVQTHPTAETVYLAVKEDLPCITLATVYRNLNQLAEQGEILRLEINKEYHYDADMSYHQHCVCNHCGQIMDLFQKEISKYCLGKIRIKDFQPTSANIIFHGLCKKCGGVENVPNK